MTDRLADLIVGLQRMAEGARVRGDDLEYTQREERYEHIRYLDQLLMMVEKLRTSLMEDRKRFMPVENRIDNRIQEQAVQPPKFIQQARKENVNG
jgi:hypothetical protein